MKLFKLSALSLAITSALTLSGCGSSDSTATDVTTTEESTIATTDATASATDTTADTNIATDVTLERGPVLFSHMIDSQGVKAEPVKDDNGNPTNIYRFALTPDYPITATGGYIDLDASGSLSAGDVAMGNLQLQIEAGDVITLASALANIDGNLATLQALGFSTEQLMHETPSSNLMIAALSDEIYAYIAQNNITDLSLIDLSALSSQIATRMSLYSGSTQSALELEQTLINELGDAVTTIDQARVDELLASVSALSITQESFDTIPMTAEQQSLIAYSWNEEKMAKDLYNSLYDALMVQGTEIKALVNVATNSETQHQEAMRALAEKHDLDLINLSDTQVTYGYDGAALAAVPVAEFPLSAIQDMYNGLWDHATANGLTAQSALEAACIVEVEDVNDLNHSIEEATALGAYELVAAFESLRSGSYSHYWAFNNALVSQGVSEGCGVLGAYYVQDYPQVPKGGQPADAGAPTDAGTTVADTTTDTTLTTDPNAQGTGAADGTGNQYGKLGITPPGGSTTDTTVQ